MEACINHPDHAAIEHCEICGDPLCDLCLWYADDGRRLCEVHARKYEEQGGDVQSPEQYQGGIRVREMAETTLPIVPYQGNQTDLMAAAAALIAGTTVLSMFGGFYCLPFLSLLLAITALTHRRKGFDADRTRLLGVIGIALSVLSLLPIFLFFCFFVFSFTLGFGSLLVNP